MSSSAADKRRPRSPSPRVRRLQFKENDRRPSGVPVISTEIFQQLIQSTNDSIVVTLAAPLAPPGPIVSYVNPAFTALTGLT